MGAGPPSHTLRGFNWTGPPSPHPRAGELQGPSLPHSALCALPGPDVPDTRDLRSRLLRVRDAWRSLLWVSQLGVPLGIAFMTAPVLSCSLDWFYTLKRGGFPGGVLGTKVSSDTREGSLLHELGNIALHLPPYVPACLLSHSVISDSLPPVDCSPPGSSVHVISQARILEWAAISSYRRSSPSPVIEPMSPIAPALAGRLFIILYHLGSPCYVQLHFSAHVWWWRMGIQTSAVAFLPLFLLFSLQHFFLFFLPCSPLLWPQSPQPPLCIGSWGERICGPRIPSTGFLHLIFLRRAFSCYTLT